MNPLVSVLIPTYERPDLLLRAVRSVLSQCYANIEVVITDNSASDESKYLLSSLVDSRVFYYKNEENIGPILNWRKALELSTGKYCLILPDDDFISNPFFIEDAVCIAEDNSVNLVISNCILDYPQRTFIGDSHYVGLIDGRTFLEGLWSKYTVPTIANLFNREVALSLNAFNSNDILYSDMELWIKIMLMGGDIYCYKKPSIFYFFHGDNIVTNMPISALIKNSAFIDSALSFGSGVDAGFKSSFVYRYVLFISSIYSVYSYRLVRGVFIENKLKYGVVKNYIKFIYKKRKKVIKALIGR